MKISKIRKSRGAWKSKATERGAKLRALKKRENARRKRANNIASGRDVPRPLNMETENTRQENIPVVLPETASAHQQRVLCVLVVIVGIASFRSVPRILQVFLPLLRVKLKVPHFTSVIHWALRVGVAVFNQVTMIHCPWVAVIDTSIDIGIRKALVVLRIPLAAFQNKNQAVGLEDCECIGLEVSRKWNGQLVAEALDKIIGKAGAPLAIIKDGGTDLNKGVTIFCEKHPELAIQMIDDIGHFTANALKALFAQAKPFLEFLKITFKGAARIRQTTLACLLPPKVRSKGRFQGISAVAEWAQNMLAFIGGQRRTKEGSEVNRARKAFAGLSKLRPFLARFCNICMITDKLQKLMKTAGLNQASYTQAKKILEKLPTRSLVRIRLSAWLEKHIRIHRAMGIGESRLLVSSDVIESLFGKFKTIIQRNPLAELNRLVYIIPLLCGNLSPANIGRALAECSHMEMLRQIEKTIPPTLRQQRHNWLFNRSKSVPKSGNFKHRETG